MNNRQVSDGCGSTVPWTYEKGVQDATRKSYLALKERSDGKELLDYVASDDFYEDWTNTFGRDANYPLLQIVMKVINTVEPNHSGASQGATVIQLHRMVQQQSNKAPL